MYEFQGCASLIFSLSVHLNEWGINKRRHERIFSKDKVRRKKKEKRRTLPYGILKGENHRRTFNLKAI
jgi:hypothetical protein